MFSVRFPSLSQSQTGDGAYWWFLRGLLGGQKSIEPGDNEEHFLDRETVSGYHRVNGPLVRSKKTIWEIAAKSGKDGHC